MIAAAVFSLLIADLGFAYKNSIDSYGTGAMVDAGWVLGWLLLMATALKPTVAELRRSDDEDEPSITRLALPYAPLVVAAVTPDHPDRHRRVRAVPGLHRHHDRAAGHLPPDRRPGREPPAQRPPPGHRGALSEREQELKDGLRRELAAADRLRAADDMKDTFLRAVSHDLRTPLTAMLGVAVTLERTRLNLPRNRPST